MEILLHRQGYASNPKDEAKEELPCKAVPFEHDDAAFLLVGAQEQREGE